MNKQRIKEGQIVIVTTDEISRVWMMCDQE